MNDETYIYIYFIKINNYINLTSAHGKKNWRAQTPLAGSPCATFLGPCLSRGHEARRSRVDIYSLRPILSVVMGSVLIKLC
jgi:hypothetical protein